MSFARLCDDGLVDIMTTRRVSKTEAVVDHHLLELDHGPVDKWKLATGCATEYDHHRVVAFYDGRRISLFNEAFELLYSHAPACDITHLCTFSGYIMFRCSLGKVCIIDCRHCSRMVIIDHEDKIVSITDDLYQPVLYHKSGMVSVYNLNTRQVVPQFDTGMVGQFNILSGDMFPIDLTMWSPTHATWGGRLARYGTIKHGVYWASGCTIVSCSYGTPPFLLLSNGDVIRAGEAVPMATCVRAISDDSVGTWAIRHDGSVCLLEGFNDNLTVSSLGKADVGNHDRIEPVESNVILVIGLVATLISMVVYLAL